MSYQTFVVPYMRTSPIRIPRRDMTLGLVDSLALTVQVVDQDSPDAVPLDLTGGDGGYVLQMIVWADAWRGHTWDYGYPNSWGYGWGCYYPAIQRPWTVLWVGTATISDGAAGKFLISFPTGTMGATVPPTPATTWTWPARCSYALQLDWNGGSETTLLAEGKLNLSRSVARTIAPVVMLTDPMPPVLTDDSSDMILLDGAMPS